MARCLATPLAILLLMAAKTIAASSQEAFNAKVVTIVGAQFGDEPKGGITDILTVPVNAVVRYNTYDGPGRSIVLRGQAYKLNIIPLGILHKEVICLLSSDTVIDPEMFIKEIKILKDNGIAVSPNNLKISENAIITLPLDLEDQADIVITRQGVKAIDLTNLDNLEKMKNLEKKVEALVKDCNALRNRYGKKEVNSLETISHLKDQAVELAPYITDISGNLDQHKGKNKKILIENVRSIWPEHPSSASLKNMNTLATAINANLGIPLKNNHVMGVIKAYATRSGGEPFPTLLDNELGAKLREIGQEFSSPSKVRRECGWLDLVTLKHSIKINGIQSLALAKTDVLDNFTYIKVCIGYEIDGERTDQMPLDARQWQKIIPVYHEFNGWKKIRGIDDYDKLDENFKAFVKFIENETGIPIVIVSTGPERSDKILRQTPFDLIAN